MLSASVKNKIKKCRNNSNLLSILDFHFSNIKI